VISSLHDDLTLLRCLVDDLQTLSLTEAGKLPLHLERLSVAAEVERCVRAQTGDGPERVSVAVEAGLEVVADPTRFQQIVANLVRNALTHAHGASRIEVTGRAAEDSVELVVSDNGPGVAPEHLPHIFDRFYRGDPSRDRATGGAGLGLAVAKNLVELHGGRIEARSEPGRGAAFHIHLPSQLG
jgi:signal transduction histidine kinase